MKTVKLPVVIQNNKQAEMGVASPDQRTGFGIFNINQIEAVLQTHDDSLGSEQVNCEATHLQLKSSASYYIPMFIDEVLNAISTASESYDEDHLKI